MKIKITGLVIMGLLVGALITGCTDKKQPVMDREAMVGEEALEENKKLVKVEQVEERRMAKSIKYVAKAEPAKRRQLDVEVKGDLSQVFVKVGQSVEPGQAMYAIDREQAYYQINEAQKQINIVNLEIKTKQERLAKLENSGKETVLARKKEGVQTLKLQLDEAKSNVDINEKLIEQGSISEQVYASSKLKLQKVEREFEEAVKAEKYYGEKGYEQEYRSARIDLDQTVLRKAQLEKTLKDAKGNKDNLDAMSPIKGIVSSMEIKEGTTVSKGKMEIINIDKIKANFGISEKVLEGLKVGDKVKVLVGSEDKELEGQIDGVSPFADSKTNNYNVEVSLDNEGYIVKPGMVLDIIIDLEVRENAVVVEENAVLETINQKYVYKVVDGIAVQQFIKIGIADKGKVEVTEGLATEDQVIVSGHHIVKDQDQVKISGDEN